MVGARWDAFGTSVLGTRCRGAASMKFAESTRSRSSESGTSLSRPHDETGAVLILALVYIIVISITVGALAYWATNGLNNTTQFYTGAQLQYAASAAVQTAVQSIQTAPQPGDPDATQMYNGVSVEIQNIVHTVAGTTYPLYTSSPGVCWNNAAGTVTVSSLTFYSTLTIDVFCSTVENLSHSVGANGTRVVTISACQYSASLTGTSCASSPLLQAVFSFDDYPSGGGSLLTQQCNVEGLACGEGSTELSWIRG